MYYISIINSYTLRSYKNGLLIRRSLERGRILYSETTEAKGNVYGKMRIYQLDEMQIPCEFLPRGINFQLPTATDLWRQ